MDTKCSQLIAMDGWVIKLHAMTLYLKYRPQRIADLDLGEVRAVLQSMLTKEKLPHAWLFTGPWGTGKTSAARILAKAVNCLHRDGVEPCNKCEMCQEITAGSATDIVEIDAASNRGIEEIRELRDKVRLAPMKAKVKVYIIDEVHMLTTEAANALLKTLEEPPEHTLFALCTTEPEKLLDTVKSRCVWVKFKKPTVEEAVSSLEHVLTGEKVKFEAKALRLLAEAARGSFRDGTKILEQVIMAKNTVTEESVREVLGWIGSADPETFLKFVRGGRTEEALEFIADLVKQGVNLRGWVERVTEKIRIELIENSNQKASGNKIDEILKEIAGMEKVYMQMKTTAVAQLPLEIFVIESRRAGDLPAGRQVGESVNDKKPELKPEEKKPEEKIVIPGKSEVAGNVGQFKLEDVTARWAEIMKQVRPMNHSVEALLRSTRPMDFDGEKLTLEVFYKFHKDKLETEKCRSIVEGAVGQVFGKGPVKLLLKLGDKKNKGGDLSGVVEEDIVKAAEAIFKVEAV